MKYENLIKIILKNVGDTENINNVTHCMTRLRFVLKDLDKANQEELKKIDEIMGVVYKGGQLQLIIGPQVTDVYDELIKMAPTLGTEIHQEVETKEEEKPKGIKRIGAILNNIMGALSGSLVPLIPVLLCAGLCKTIVAVLGPQLFNVISETSDIYKVFTFVGDAGFYFMPIFAGFTAAKKFGCSQIIGALLGAILIHPTLIEMATKGTAFTVYGIPALAQSYASTVIPIILIVWVMSYVERFFKKYVPDALKVVGIPFGTLIVMLPLELCILGPSGAYIGKYICNAILALQSVAGPIALAVVGATFLLLVMTGMHTALFTFLILTFTNQGYESFMMPAMFVSSFATCGVALACYFKFKDPKNKQLTLSYFLTWFFGGVGEPFMYGLLVPYKTPFYVSMAAGGVAGLIAGILGLTSYVFTPSNGIYFFAAFLGGPSSNYIILAICTVVSIALGFAMMWFAPLNENINN